MSEIIRHYTNEFRSSRDVQPMDAEVFFDEIISVDDTDALAAMLSAWARKGTTEDELFRFAAIMRDRMHRLESKHPKVCDIVGTGGSRAKTFNVSTAAAFIAAAAGSPVAKHGNRAATSKTGSTDVLSALGMNVDISREMTASHLQKHGICFMFAPRFHSLTKHLAAARRMIDSPTIFNNLGPLCNPALASHSVIGVWDRKLVTKTARVLFRFSPGRTWVVHGENGLDEITLNGRTFVAEIDGGNIREFEIEPKDFGINEAVSEIRTASSPEESAAIITGILENKMPGSDEENLVLINAAALLNISGKGETKAESYLIAKENIRNGNAAAKLKAMQKESK